MHNINLFPRMILLRKLGALLVLVTLLLGAVQPALAQAGDSGVEGTPAVIIKVFKFEDKNFNQVQDAGEGPLAGWQFSLLLPDGSRYLAVSGEDGYARFTNLPLLEGSYQVSETLQNGWTNTTPLTQSRVRSQADPWMIWRVVFGNAQTGVIKIIKFNDLDGDGVWDEASEGGLGGIEFVLYRLEGESWVEAGRGVSNANGRLVFTHLPLGTYRVEEILSGDYQNTTPLVQEQSVGAEGFRVFYFGNQLLPKEFGDLPALFGITTLAENGARHLPGNAKLGALVDVELDGQPSLDARQDDTSNQTDEDGVQGVFAAPDYWNSGQGTVAVTVSGDAGCFNAWLDVWNSATNTIGGDNDFGDSGEGWSEHAIVNLLLEPGAHTLNFPLPQRSSSPDIFARFRLSPLVDGSCAAYAGQELLLGLQTGGEVEDMLFRFGPTAVELSGFSAETSDSHPLLVLGVLWLVGLSILTLALDMQVRHRH